MNRKIVANIFAGLLLAAFFAQCFIFAAKTGQTVDETFYNGSGYPIVRYNDYRIIGEHPPLMMQIASLPLLFMDVKYPIDDVIWLGDSGEVDVTKMGLRFLYEMGNDPGKILLAERTMLILLAVFMGIFLYRWAKEMYGVGPALFVLALYSFSPNVIANSSQYMTDMGVTIFMFLSIYRLSKFFRKPNVRNAVLCGLCYGLALMSKMSSLVLFPTTLLLFSLYPLLSYKSLSSYPQNPPRLDLALLVMSILFFTFAVGEKLVLCGLGPICLTVIWMTSSKYKAMTKAVWPKLLRFACIGGFIACFAVAIYLSKKREMIIVVGAALWVLSLLILNFLIERLKKKEELIYLAKIFVLIWFVAALVIVFGYTDFYKSLMRWNPFQHYLRAFKIATSHSVSTHEAYMPGSYIVPGKSYYLNAMLVKTPLLTIGSFLIGAVGLCFSKLPRMNKLCIFIPMLVFFCVASFLNKINIGIRHVLPLYPFIFLVAGSAFFIIQKIKVSIIRKVIFGIIFCLLLSYSARTLAVSPHHMTYFNEIVGSAEAGGRLLSTNGGQDNRRLVEVVKEKRIPFIKIRTVSNNPDLYDYYEIRWEPMKDEEYNRPGPGFYALDLETHHIQQTNPNSWFLNKQPRYKAGKTIYIFEVPSS